MNRGASWARIQLPTGHVLHFFTCHLAPPLNEVAGRGGRLLLRLQCPQQKQLQELVEFMRECIQPDRDAWEKECAEAASATSTDGSAGGTAGPARVRPFSVVLAGDFNLDCGSLRYFSLLHALHSLDPAMRDLFASEEEEGQDGADAGVGASRCLRHGHSGAAAVLLHQGGELIGLVDDDQEEEQGSKANSGSVEEQDNRVQGRDNNAGDGLSRRRVGTAASHGQLATGSPSAPASSSAPASPSASGASSPSPSPSPSSSSPVSPSRLHVAANSWSIERGNGREPYSPELHAPYRAVIRSPRLHWQATFGQVMTPAKPARADSGAPGGCGGQSPSARAESESSAQAASVARSRVVHQETFLTHETLLGTHSTHDFIFSSLRPRATAVEPFLAPHALHRLLHHPDRQACGHAVAGQDDPDEAEAAAALADMYEGSSVTAAQTGRRAVPPYQQLSDHCALLATLMLPEESAAV